MKTHELHWSRRALLALGVCAVGAWTASAMLAQSEGAAPDDKLLYPRTIVLVRHAEKALEPKDDPNVTEEGAARAKRLSDLLGKSGVTHVFASEYQRTQQTVAPLSVAAGVNVQIVAARQGDALLSALESLRRNSLAVVCGHSNTVPALLERLTGGQAKLRIEDSEYDRLFIVTQWGPGRDARAIELRY
jgi:broad specificity phosphatase PhoE